MVVVEVLGRIAVRRDEQRCERFETAATAELLAALVAAEPRRCRRAELIERLWPGDNGAPGRHRLASTLHRLRNVVEGNGEQRGSLIAADRAGIALGAGITSDLDEWRNALRAAEQAVGPAEERLLLGAAAGLYTGDFSPELTSPWAVSLREALRQRHLESLLRLGELLLGEDRAEQAVRLLGPEFERQPGHETLAALLLRALEAGPDPDAGRRVLALCERALGGRSNGAVQAAAGWLRVAPAEPAELPRPAMERALACLRDEDPAGALLWFDQADGVDPLRTGLTAAACPRLEAWCDLGAAARCLAVAPDGERLAVGLHGGGVAIVEPRTGRSTRLPGGFTPSRLAIDAAGRWLAAGTTAGELWLWSLPDQTLAAKLTIDGSPVSALAFSSDGRLLAAGTHAGLLRLVWLGDRPLLERGRTVGRVTATATDPSGRWLFFGDGAGALHLLDPATGTWHLRHRVFAGSLSRLSASPDGQRLAVAAGGEAGLIDLHRDGHHRVLVQHGRSCIHVAFGGGGRWLASAGTDGAIEVTELADAGPVRTARQHWGQLAWLRTAPCGQVIAGADAAGTLRFALLPSLRPGARAAHPGWRAAAWLPGDRPRLVTAGADGTARVYSWPTAGGLAPRRRMAHRYGSHLASIEYSPDGQRLVTAGGDGQAVVWDVASGAAIARLGHPAMVWQATFSPDGRHVATACRDGTARLWPSDGGRPVAEMRHPGAVRAVRFTAAGDRLLSGSDPAAVYSWTVPDGQPTAAPLRCGRAPHGIPRFALTPDERWLVVADAAGWVERLDHRDGATVGRRLGIRACNAAVPLDDGRHVVLATGDGTVLLLRADDLTVDQAIRASTAVHGVAVSPDGRHCATAAIDGTVRLWDLETGRPTCPPRQHDDWSLTVAFAPGGELLASAGNDGAVWLWSVPDGEPLGPTLRHGSHVFAIAFSPDGRQLATASCDGEVRIYTLPDACDCEAVRRALLGGGRGLDATGGFEPLTPEHLRAPAAG